MRDDLDNDLLQLFEENNLELSDEPFGAELRRRIEKTRNVNNRMYWLLIALTLVVCISLTNFVISGVTLFCRELTNVLQSAGEIFATPAGWAAAVAAVLLSLVFYRRSLSFFV